MSNILILMRHGKAERPVEGKLDMERRLTEFGKRSLSATLPHSLALLDRKASVQIWSSPAARADQTARLVLRACKRLDANVDPDVRTVDTLWSQSAEPFMEAVRACESDVVIAVGHNPFIEVMATRLTGSHIRFATGGLCAMKLDSVAQGAPRADIRNDAQVGAQQVTQANSSPDEPAARLLWFVQGPVSQRWKTLVSMERTLAGAADTVKDRLIKFKENPDDVETMHKFRVSIRTLRSLLAFTQPWQDVAQNKKAQARLKSLVGQTSRLRELDVLTEQADEMEGATPQLAEYCAGLAADERQRVLDSLSSKRSTTQLERVISELHDIKWRKNVNAQGLGADEVRARFDKLATALQDDLAVLDLSDAEATHDVRKAAKRVRYDAEKFSSLVGEDAVDIAKNMTAHQDNLGAICDARVNIEIINALPAEDVPEPVSWDLALLRAKNETYLYTTLRES